LRNAVGIEEGAVAALDAQAQVLPLSHSALGAIRRERLAHERARPVKVEEVVDQEFEKASQRELIGCRDLAQAVDERRA
jgi:hypothetical protein